MHTYGPLKFGLKGSTNVVFFNYVFLTVPICFRYPCSSWKIIPVTSAIRDLLAMSLLHSFWAKFFIPKINDWKRFVLSSERTKTKNADPTASDNLTNVCVHILLTYHFPWTEKEELKLEWCTQNKLWHIYLSETLWELLLLHQHYCSGLRVKQYWQVKNWKVCYEKPPHIASILRKAIDAPCCKEASTATLSSCRLKSGAF